MFCIPYFALLCDAHHNLTYLVWFGFSLKVSLYESEALVVFSTKFLALKSVGLYK